MGSFAGLAVAEVKLTPKAPISAHAASILRRARKLPVGPARNDLRRLARALVKLHKRGFHIEVQMIEPETLH